MNTGNQILHPIFCNLDRVLNINNKDHVVKSLYVPKFQRYYSWEEKDVVQLLSNIYESLENNDEYYFLGTIQLTDFNEDERFAIIDGQQRITTVLLIIKCLMNKIENNDLRIVNIDITNNTIYQGYYNDVFKNGSISNCSSENNLYYKNFQIIENYLNEKDDNKNNDIFEKKLLNYILEKIHVIVILSVKQPLSKILEIFNTLNTTGMDLNSGDLFKIKFAEYLIDGEANRYEETIEKISEQYERIAKLNEEWKDEKWSIDEVLINLQHILIAHDNSPLEELKKGREKYFEDYFANKDKRYLTFGRFKTLIDVICKIVEMKNNANLEFKYRYAQDILFWTRYWRCWSFPYISLFFKADNANGVENVDSEWIKNIFKNEYFLAQFLTVYSVLYGRYIDDIYRYYITILAETKHEIGNDDYFQYNFYNRLKEDVDKWEPTKTSDKNNTGEVINEFKERIQKDLVNKYVICKWVALFEELNHSRKTDEEMKDLMFNFSNNSNYKCDIEHIFPRNRFKEIKENIEYFEGIGNLTLLEQKINRNVKDDMKKKCEEYQNSKFWLPNDIVGSYVNSETFNWTIDDIKKRINSIIELFKDEFTVINSKYWV